MKLLTKSMLIGLLHISYLSMSQIIIELDTPSTSAKIFAPQFISTGESQRDLAISPNGDEIFYSVVKSAFVSNIYYIKKSEGSWSVPALAPFSGNDQDFEPAFSPDGEKLFFSSKRNGNYDIFYVERTASGWSNPIDVGAPVNTNSNEFYPSVARDGTLYWTAEYVEGKGGEDIWSSAFVDGEYQDPIVLEDVNTPFDEYNAFVDPDKRFIYFGSFNRMDDLGGGDIYRATGNGDGTFSAGLNVTQINTSSLDYCPYVSPDGRFLFFTSERSINEETTSNNPFDFTAILDKSLNPTDGSNIYWIKR